MKADSFPGGHDAVLTGRGAHRQRAGLIGHLENRRQRFHLSDLLPA